ncbi:MAG: hypothetical protein ACAI25_04405 [Planctomycetota bacterium]
MAIGLLLLGGCGATTHPRYSADLTRRWPGCQRILVLPGDVAVEVKNYLAGDFFVQPTLGVRIGQELSIGVARVLRRSARDVRGAWEAEEPLGGGGPLRIEVADRMLAHARDRMALDAGYSSEVLAGLPADSGVVPAELRRHYDAIVVVGGRTRMETDEERLERYKEIAIRNVISYPLMVAGILVPPLFPFVSWVTANVYRPSLYWRGAENGSYFSLAVFDATTGRLLYTNDWFDAERIVDSEDCEKVARELLGPLRRIRGSETAPLGERPPHWEN